MLDGHLKGRAWIAGERLTIADFSIGALVPSAQRMDLPIGRFREIARWYESLSALPAWRDALAAWDAAADAWLRPGRTPTSRHGVPMIARSLALAATLALTTLACGSTTLPASSPSTSAAIEARVPSADGVPIHYVVEGSGPTVVLLHCLGCNLHYWDVPAAKLARDHRVVRLDYAGHGGSGSERKTWGIDGFVADVRAVLDAAGVDRFTLVGHSMSGPIGIEVANELGERVTGVVPVDTLLDADERLPEEQRAATLAQVRTHYRDFVVEFLPHLMPKNPNPSVFERVKSDALA